MYSADGREGLWLSEKKGKGEEEDEKTGKNARLPPPSPSTSCFQELFSELNPLYGALQRATNSSGRHQQCTGYRCSGEGAWCSNGFSRSFVLDHGADTL